MHEHNNKGSKSELLLWDRTKPTKQTRSLCRGALEKSSIDHQWHGAGTCSSSTDKACCWGCNHAFIVGKKTFYWATTGSRRKTEGTFAKSFVVGNLFIQMKTKGKPQDQQLPWKQAIWCTKHWKSLYCWQNASSKAFHLHTFCMLILCPNTYFINFRFLHWKINRTLSCSLPVMYPYVANEPKITLMLLHESGPVLTLTKHLILMQWYHSLLTHWER